MNNAKSKIPQFVSAGIFILCVFLCLPSTVQAQAPVIKEAKVVTTTFIELDWEGTQYINNAGASKENTSATVNHFEVLLNGTRLNQSSPWYWNITNYSLHGVRVNQNKTTLRLSTALTTAQMTALENGTSTMTVRITSTDVTASANSSPSTTGTPANTTTTYSVVYKPYYDKTVVSQSGVPLRGSEFVLLSTVQKAADMVDVILSAAPENLLARMRNSTQFMIFGPGEHSYNIPEHRSMFLRDAWNRAEGYGGNISATSAANVERHHIIPAAQRPYESSYASGYRDESILAHEFGHGIHSPGMSGTGVVNLGAPSGTTMSSELTAIRASAIALPENPANPDGRKKWQGQDPGSFTYMSQNASEFMATAVSIWFDAMAEGNWSNNGRSPVSTREQLRRYDTPFYNFLSRVLPETKALSEVWGRDVPNRLTPFFAPEPPEPAGRYGPSVKIKSTLATNPAGSGLSMYIPFNAAANTITNVELWWDVNTDLMRWYLEPNDDESYFRIKKKIERSYTLNTQSDNMVLTPTGSAVTAGTRIGLAAVSSSDEAQWWGFNRQSNGTFTITNKTNPQMFLTLENDATASGTRIVLENSPAGSRFWNVDGDVPLTSGAVTNIASSSFAVPGANNVRAFKFDNRGNLKYNLGGAQLATMKIFDSKGRTLKTIRLSGNENTVNTNLNAAAQMLLWKVEINGKIVDHGRIGMPAKNNGYSSMIGIR